MAYNKYPPKRKLVFKDDPPKELPEMEFERIAKRFQGKKYKSENERVKSKSMMSVKSTSMVNCPACGEQFEFILTGPRAGCGMCECGFTLIA